MLTVIVLVLVNLTRIPWFFAAVFSGAFPARGHLRRRLRRGAQPGHQARPDEQRGPARAPSPCPAAAADAKHPCDQGCVQALGVFLDTIVICTLTGFVVVMGRMWTGADGAAWMELGKLDKFLASCGGLTGGVSGAYHLVTILVSLCFCLFAYTCLVGFMSFTEMCAKRISANKVFINVIRVICLLVISFRRHHQHRRHGSGRAVEPERLCQYPDGLLQPAPAVYRPALCASGMEALREADGTHFTSEVAGIDRLPVWDEKANSKK